jgi:hypothetical protein
MIVYDLLQFIKKGEIGIKYFSYKEKIMKTSDRSLMEFIKKLKSYKNSFSPSPELSESSEKIMKNLSQKLNFQIEQIFEYLDLLKCY